MYPYLSLEDRREKEWTWKERVNVEERLKSVLPKVIELDRSRINSLQEVVDGRRNDYYYMDVYQIAPIPSWSNPRFEGHFLKAEAKRREGLKVYYYCAKCKVDFNHPSCGLDVEHVIRKFNELVS